MRYRTIVSICVAWCTLAGGGAARAADWPMLGCDARRSGATADEIRPPFTRKWYRLFGDEGIQSGVQPIVAGGKVYVGTLAGVLHAMDAETGKDAWSFRAAGPILHAVAVEGGRVFFGGGDGCTYALDAGSGRQVWRVSLGPAVWNAPAVRDGVVYVGGRDGRLYALDAATGERKWVAPVGGPILASTAIDERTRRVVVAAEDMRVYAFALADGKQAWVSEKLPGVSFRGYYPVIAPDGSVMVTSQPALNLDAFQDLLMQMVKDVFGDMASWRHKKDENERLRQANFEQLSRPETYGRQLDWIRKRLTDRPELQTFFVLDGRTGKPRFVAPVVYSESMNGTGAPAVVAPNGQVIVKYQVLLRSRYGAYSPFLNVGYLDPATGHITQIMDPSRTYGWHDSLLLVHDEQCQLSVAGRVLINTHQDNVNAMDLDTLQGYGQPFARGIHEPAAGEAVSIWANLLAGRELPHGKEWLARGTAVYGGGSVLDVPVSIAGSSFYYLPTHEINAGAAVIAMRMIRDRKAAPPAVEATLGKLTDEQWGRVQKLDWDWDTLAMPRLDHVLKALPTPVPGTNQAPRTAEAEAVVAKIPDAELNAFLDEPAERAEARTDDPAMAAELKRAVAELVSANWRPLLFPCGKHPVEAYRFLGDPAELLYTLARAYPHLDATSQADVRAFVARLRESGGPLAGPTGAEHLNPDAGSCRTPYEPPAKAMRLTRFDIALRGPARIYPQWLWARVTGDHVAVDGHWPDLRKIATQAEQEGEWVEDCGNGRLAGLIAATRLARRAKDPQADALEAEARKAMRARLVWELARPRGGLISRVAANRGVFSRWRHLTPEVAALLARYAGKTHADLMRVYVDHHRPAWYVAWNVETMWRNEAPMELPTTAADIFAARGMILRQPASELRKFLDIPWCKGDLFYIQKLVLCMEGR